MHRRPSHSQPTDPTCRGYDSNVAARCRRAEDESDKKRDRFVDRATSDRQLPSIPAPMAQEGETSLSRPVAQS